MPHTCDPRYQYCKRVGRNVRVCRLEADCRREHGCIKPNCPLETAFGLEAFDARMRAFATIFDLWPLAEDQQPDFP
jgi:hypothetical protein